jgi:hypothetical protein
MNSGFTEVLSGAAAALGFCAVCRPPEAAIIVDVEATRAIRQAVVGARAQ